MGINNDIHPNLSNSILWIWIICSSKSRIAARCQIHQCGVSRLCGNEFHKNALFTSELSNKVLTGIEGDLTLQEVVEDSELSIWIILIHCNAINTLLLISMIEHTIGSIGRSKCEDANWHPITIPGDSDDH